MAILQCPWADVCDDCNETKRFRCENCDHVVEVLRSHVTDVTCISGEPYISLTFMKQMSDEYESK